MKNFKDLPSREVHGGIQHFAFYPNGYGASIVKHKFSYGNERGLWELAVLKGTDQENFELCYSTPITGDVIGHLTEEEVNSILQQISELK